MARRATILVADHESSIRSLISLILHAQGYRVLEASGLGEALHHLAPGEPLDLLLVELDLPSSSGVKLAQELRKQVLDLPVLYLTGGGPGALTQHGLNPDAAQVLCKPFSALELSRLVRLILQEHMSVDERDGTPGD